MIYKDKVFSRVWLRLPWISRLQILLTGKVHIETIVETENIIGRTLGNTTVSTHWPSFRKTSMMEAKDSDENLEKVRRVLEE